MFIPAAEVSEDINRKVGLHHNNSTDQAITAVINLAALEILPSRALDT